MEEADKRKLRINFIFLVDNVRVGDIRDYLYSEGVLTEDDMEKLSLMTLTERDKTRTLLLILPKRGSKAFRVFLEALNECSYPFAAEKIQSTDPHVADTGPDEIDTFIQEEEKFSRLHQQILMQTELILGFKKEVDDLRLQLRSSEEQSAMLKKHYTHLERQMMECGLTGDHVVPYLKDFAVRVEQDTVDSGSVEMRKKMPGALVRPHGDKTTQLAYEIAADITAYIALHTTQGQTTKYTKTMRKVVDQLSDTYNDQFTELIKKLDIRQINGLQTICAVAEGLFADGTNNWGRIVTLYAFGGFVAKQALESNVADLADVIADFIGFYVSKTLKPWIDSNNGWVMTLWFFAYNFNGTPFYCH